MERNTDTQLEKALAVQERVRAISEGRLVIKRESKILPYPLPEIFVKQMKLTYKRAKCLCSEVMIENNGFRKILNVSTTKGCAHDCKYVRERNAFLGPAVLRAKKKARMTGGLFLRDLFLTEEMRKFEFSGQAKI